ncbi:hypothetical protein KA082_00025 [Candidatus Woesebacteria bacterium]|nr:hypothetical protein [Candidatus Woesebacteria bacterium]
MKTNFQIALGIVGMLGFMTLSYLVLRMDSSLGVIYLMTSTSYFYVYIGLTLITAFIFGVQLSILGTQWYTYGIKNSVLHTGSGVGALLGIIGSSCPVCGSTLLSLFATLTGISSLATVGIELKIASLLIMLGATFYTYKKFSTAACDESACPVPVRAVVRTHSYISMIALLGLFTVVNFKLYTSDPIRIVGSENPDYSAYSCSNDHK